MRILNLYLIRASEKEIGGIWGEFVDIITEFSRTVGRHKSSNSGSTTYTKQDETGRELDMEMERYRWGRERENPSLDTVRKISGTLSTKRS